MSLKNNQLYSIHTKHASHTATDARAHTNTLMYTCTRIHMYTHTQHTHVHTHNTHIHMYAHTTHTCTHIHMYTHTTHTCTHIHMYTHTH